MQKIIQFSDWDIPFIYTTLSWAIEDLKFIDENIETISYSYNDLRNDKISRYNDNIILWIEGGQTQLHHSNWNIPKFKKFFPNSKIVLHLSDTMYYTANNLSWQFGKENKHLIDLIIDFTPRCSEYWNSIGINSTCLPWTHSKRLHNQLKKLTKSHVDFNRKTKDFICLANFSGEYRQNLKNFLADKRYTLETGGNHQDCDLNQTYKKFLNSWINIGTTSHNRPELNITGQHTLKAFRDSVGIALNSLLVYDDEPDVDKVWDIKGMPRWRFDDFSSLVDIYEYYRYDLVGYRARLKEQQLWLENNLLDQKIYDNLKKFKII